MLESQCHLYQFAVESINEVSSRDLRGLEDSILVLVSTFLLSKGLLAGELPTDLDAGFSLFFIVNLVQVQAKRSSLLWFCRLSSLDCFS